MKAQVLGNKCLSCFKHDHTTSEGASARVLALCTLQLTNTWNARTYLLHESEALTCASLLLPYASSAEYLCCITGSCLSL